MSDLFYVAGIALTVGALVISFFGLRSERFPDSRPLYAGVLGVMGALVVASCAFAIVLSREEAEHRAEEVAHYEAEQAEEAAAEAESAQEEQPGSAAAEAPEVEPAGTQDIPAETLTLTSPEDGALVFDPTELQAKAGNVSIEYENPSPVPHNVAIEAGSETLAESATVSGGDSGTAEATLDPGEYVFYCAIPGHREAGMEGTLTVK